MSGGRKWILYPFTGRKKTKSLEYDKRKIYAGWKKRKFSWNRQLIILQSRGMVWKILKGAFYNGSSSADGDNDDENYNKNNEQQQLS